ncbi:MAG: hypothetical protein IPJ75_19105 [Ignavibacteriales bacterium]|nr:hypothetical protein [Ignavibacteriales bacterium]
MSALSPLKGPVHINLPFEKPLEPSSFNCEVTQSELSSLHSLVNLVSDHNSFIPDNEIELVNPVEINPDHKVLIILANKQYNPEFWKN